jgi:hypothetical protein
MKSIKIASAAVAATVVALAGVAQLWPTPEQLLGRSYDHGVVALPEKPTDIMTAAHAPGSEHFWLTERGNATAAPIDRASTKADPIAASDIKLAIAAAGLLDVGTFDLLDVQTITRATLGVRPQIDAPAVSQALLVTTKIQSTSTQPGRIVRFVLDVGTGPTGRPANAL